jgi:5'-nucleotidase (lipoprotein e(P4) family)
MKKVFIFSFCALFVMSAYAQGDHLTIHQATDVETKVIAVLWQQTSAEYRALCYQAFNLAALRIQQIPKKDFRKNKLAIITDLDETILDNSYASAQMMKEGDEFTPQNWNAWLDASAATGVPGAIEFLNYAKSKGISIFYISNRDTTANQSTLSNLQKLNLPDADAAHLLLLVNTSSKEARRNKVEANYKVVMLMGDNLNDFTKAFEKKSIADRFAETDKVKTEWGNRFIVLPNSSYGEWENALYNYKYNLTPYQKQTIRLEKLIGY